jgi:hypothetical protein
MKGARKISALHKSKCHGNRGHHRGSHSGDQELFQERTIALVLLCVGNKLLYSSASNMMGVKHNTKSANTKNAMKAAAQALLGLVHEVLAAARHLALGGLVKVDGYIHQEEA